MHPDPTAAGSTETTCGGPDQNGKSTSFVSTTMHSIVARVNGLSSLWSTCMMVLLGSVALSSFFFMGQPTGNIDVASLKVCVDVIPSRPGKHADVT